MAKTRLSTGYLVRLAALTAITLIMAFTPLGYLRIGAVAISFLTLPVAVAAIALDPKAGAFIGLIFGITSFAQCFMGDAFGAALVASGTSGPILTAIMCIVPRVLVGFLSGLIFRAMKGKFWKYPVAALSAALLNTILFIGTLVLFFWNIEYIQGLREVMGNTIVAFVVALVGINGLVEAIVCCIVGAAIARALLVKR